MMKLDRSTFVEREFHSEIVLGSKKNERKVEHKYLNGYYVCCRILTQCGWDIQGNSKSSFTSNLDTKSDTFFEKNNVGNELALLQYFRVPTLSTATNCSIYTQVCSLQVRQLQKFNDSSFSTLRGVP